MIRSTLSNGLRIVVQPLSGMPSVGVAVHYDVGFRSELPGRSGFAHLFEHVMFQGSQHVAPADHFRHVQASGGTANGSTHQDYTDFYQVVPASALDRLLFLEADRMRSLRVTEETLRTQIAVVKEEIRQSVTDKPYGGFPWTVLPGVLYREFRNAHNGYGTFEDLEAASLEECQAFHETYYTPANAVLTICGNVDPRRALDIADRHFGGIPARPRPATPTLDEPEPAGERRREHRDRHAALAATALGYRLPDPAASLPRYLSHMVLSHLLTGRESARLKRHTSRRAALMTDVSASCGLFGPLRARSPETLVVLAMHPPTTPVDTVLDLVDTELADLASNGPTGTELPEGRALASAGTWRGFDNLVVRTRALGTYELLFEAAELVDDLAPRLAAVTADDIRSAAAHLTRGKRAVLSLVTRKEVNR
ncbi:M16 family metallopeptidase [Streptomyces sp. NPDC127112]|uniref:M16 family metallopeptidase n=1 Tax=Streptomyces sp. NPDC127112 TaxID=3345364 RepID=UPI0036441F60